MAKVRTLADEMSSLVEVEAWLPVARSELARLRHRTRSTLTSIALANGADVGRAKLLTECDAACDAAAKQLEEIDGRAAVVRAYVDTRPRDDPSFAIPTEVRNAWGAMTMGKMLAVDEIARLVAQLDS